MMIQMKSKNKTKVLFCKVVMLSLLLAPIIGIYGPESYSYEFILTSLLAVVSLFLFGFKSNLPKVILYYLIYAAIISAAHATSSSELIPLGVIRILLVFMMYFNAFHFDWFIKWYRILAFVFISFFLFQEFTYLTTGYRMSGLIESLPMHIAKGNMSMLVSAQEYMERSSSFFSEPSHFAQFLLPLLAVEIYAKHKYHLISTGVIALSLFLSQSGNAIFGMIAIVVVYMYYVFHRTSKTKIRLIVLSVLTAIIVIPFVANSEKGQALIERTEQLTDTEVQRGEVSEFIRIYRGYYLYAILNVRDKIVGVGNQSTARYYIDHSSLSAIFEDDILYLNAFQFFLVLTGLVGCITFFYIMYWFWHRADIVGKSTIAIIFSLSFVASLYFSPTMAICLLIAYKSPNSFLDVSKQSKLI